MLLLLQVLVDEMVGRRVRVFEMPTTTVEGRNLTRGEVYVIRNDLFVDSTPYGLTEMMADCRARGQTVL